MHMGEVNVTIVKSGPGDVGRNMFLTAVSNFVVPMSALITAPILAHSLGVDGRGTLAGATAPLMLFTTVAMFGMPEAATYWVAKRPGQLRSILRKSFWILSIAGLIATSLAVGLAPIMADGNSGLAVLLGVTSLAIFPSVILGAFRGVAAGLHLWNLVNAERYIGALLRLVSIVLLASLNLLTPATAITIIAASPIFAALVYFKLSSRLSATGGERTFPSIRLIGYGSRIWIGASSGILLSRIDQVLLTPLSNTFQLGLYAAAVTVSEAALLANNAVRDVTLSADASDSASHRITTSARISFAVSIAVGAILSLTLSLWFDTVFGEDFVGAIPVTQLLIFAAVAGVPGSVAGAGLSARGRPGLRSTSLVVAAAVNVSLLLVWVPSWGAMGAAAATLVGNLVASNANLVFMKIYFQIRIRDFYLIQLDDLRKLSHVAFRIARKGALRGKK